MPNVFISSTGEDLEPFRRAAIEICHRRGLEPNAMEHFEAMGVGATEGSTRKLDQADVYVGIIAHRYGYIEDGYEKSVTEIEFDYAGSRGLDRLCFLLAEDVEWPAELVERGRRRRVASFRNKVKQELIVNEFRDLDDFKQNLSRALAAWQAQQPDPEAQALSAVCSSRLGQRILEVVGAKNGGRFTRGSDPSKLLRRAGIPTEVLMGPGGAATREITRRLLEAKRRVLFAAYTLCRAPGIDVMLISLSHKGVPVRGILAKRRSNEAWAATRTTRNAGANLFLMTRQLGHGNLEHSVVVIDDQVLIVGGLGTPQRLGLIDNDTAVVLGDLKTVESSGVERQREVASIMTDEINALILEHGRPL